MKVINLLMLVAWAQAISIKNIYRDDDEEDTTGGIVDDDLVNSIRVDARDTQALASENSHGIFSADYSAIVPSLHGSLDAESLAEFNEK